MTERDVADHEARERANRAISLIETHERGCLERGRADDEWRNNASHSLQRIESVVATQFKAISDQVGSLYSRIWIAGGGVMAALFAVIIMLVTHQMK